MLCYVIFLKKDFLVSLSKVTISAFSDFGVRYKVSTVQCEKFLL